MSLKPKQARFVREFLVDHNASAAAIRAGYSAKNAESAGSRLCANSKVKAEIEAALTLQAERLEFKADDVLRELWKLATSDIGQAFTPEGYLKPLKDIPVEIRRAIAGVDVIELPGDAGAVLRKVKFWDKTKALELLAKHHSLLVDKVEHQLKGPGWAELVVASMAAEKEPSK